MAQMGDLLAAILRIINKCNSRMTIRHLFYRLASEGIIEKTEASYASLCGHLSRWRKAGAIPFGAFVDSTRWYYGNDGFDSVEDALVNCAATYRKNLWASSPWRVEVWCEKETIASLLVEAARPYGVQVFVCRGFASLSSLYDAAETFRGYIADNKAIQILYFGDHDPSGVLVDTNVQNTFLNVFSVPINLRRVAVTREQIDWFSLPTRPSKASKHSRGFEGDSVEIDAMEPETIKGLLDHAISGYVDQDELDVLKVAEEHERELINSLVGIARNGGHR